MTDGQKQMVRTLNRCSFQPATFDKRFVRDMGRKLDEDEQLQRLGSEQRIELTEKQAECLNQIFHRYRRQHGQCRCEECRK